MFTYVVKICFDSLPLCVPVLWGSKDRISELSYSNLRNSVCTKRLKRFSLFKPFFGKFVLEPFNGNKFVFCLSQLAE